MAITHRPAEPPDRAAVQSSSVVSPLPSLRTAARANIAFIATAPDLFGAYLSYLRDDGYAVALAADVKEASVQAEAL